MWEYNSTPYSDELYHYGVPGMKWGVRRVQKKAERAERKAKKKLDKEQLKFEKNVNENWLKSYNRATDYFNKNIGTINKKYKGGFDEHFTTKKGQQYLREVNDMWQKAYSKALIEDFGKAPISKGTDWVKNAPFMDSYLDDLRD